MFVRVTKLPQASVLEPCLFLRPRIHHTQKRSAMTSPRQPHVCQHCGTVAAEMSRCSSCKEVWYCSRDHQRADWIKHKPVCKFVKEHPSVVFIRVDACVGSGLLNDMKNYVAPNKDEGLAFVSEQFHGHMSRPLRSPFAELLGWNLEVYCNTSQNDVKSGMMEVVGHGNTTLNSAGIYLGCDLQSGLSRFNNLCGPIFVCARRASDGKPLVSDALWGIQNFIYDAMDLYGDEEDPAPRIMRWAQRYRQGTWQPMGGDGGINVFCMNVNQSRDAVEQIPGTFGGAQSSS